MVLCLFEWERCTDESLEVLHKGNVVRVYLIFGIRFLKPFS